jgi:hypothetical protein
MSQSTPLANFPRFEASFVSYGQRLNLTVVVVVMLVVGDPGELESYDRKTLWANRCLVCSGHDLSLSLLCFPARPMTLDYCSTLMPHRIVRTVQYYSAVDWSSNKKK